MTPQERFDTLAGSLAGEDGVRLPQAGGRRFGSTALTVDGSTPC